MAAVELTNFGDLISRERDPDKIAIIDLGHQKKERQFSYDYIQANASGVSRGLLSQGLARGDRVAILADNCVEYISVYYGILRAGLVAVPINFKLPKASVEFIINNSGSKLIFCDSARLSNCPSGVPSVCFHDNAFNRFVDLGPFQSVGPAPNEPAMLLYTSGSTGSPKGVIISHKSLIWTANTRLGNKDLSHHRHLIATPLYHRAGLMASTQACISHSTSVLLSQFSMPNYIKAIDLYHCTCITLVPSIVAFMLQETDLLARTDTSSVELIRMTAAPISQDLMERLRHTFPRAAIVNVYAATEIGGVVFDPHPDGIRLPPLSVGRPHPQVQIRLVDETSIDASLGVLEVKSPAMMLGYYNRSDIPLPITEDGFYITNDVFRRDENNFYYFVCRNDEMFICGGINVYPQDLETLLERYPEIARACVVSVDDEIMGQKPVAFVIPRQGNRLDLTDVKRFLLMHAPSYQQPRFLWIESDFPLTAANKLDRKALSIIARSRVK